MKKLIILLLPLLFFSIWATAQTEQITAKHLRATQKWTLDTVSFTRILKVITGAAAHTDGVTGKAVYDYVQTELAGFTGAHVIADGGTPLAQKDTLNFLDNDIAFSIANTSTRTQVTATIAADSVNATHIKADAVGSSEIAADAVGSSEIAADAVGSSEIAADAVGSSEIAADAVGSSEIAADAVGNSELAANAVDSTNVVNGGLSVLDLGQHGASSGNVLKWNGTQWAPGTDNNSGGDILNGGNTTGATVVIGTNDAQALSLEVNNTVGFNMNTVYQLTATGAVSNTNTVADRFLLRTNSTGTAAANFGGALVFQGESSTTDNQDMVRLSAIWTTATHASRASALVYSDVTAGGSLTERFRFTPTSMTLATSYTFGNSANDLFITSTSSNATAIRLTTGTGAAAGASVQIGGNTKTHTTGTTDALYFTTGVAFNSGSPEFNAITIRNNIEQTGSTSTARGLYINPINSDINNYRAVEIAVNDADVKGIYQTGTLVKNYFAGNTAVGSTSTPARMLDVTGEVRISDLTTDTPTRIVGADADGDLGALKLGTGLSLSNDTLNASTGTIDGTGAAAQVAYFSDANTLTSEAALNYDATNNRLGINKSSPAVKVDIQTANSTDGVRIQSDGTADQDIWGTELVGTATGSYVQRGRISLDVYSNSGASPDGHALNFVLSRDGGSTYTPLALYNDQALFNRATAYTIANNTAELRLYPNANSQLRLHHTVAVLGSSFTTLDTTSRFRVVGRTQGSTTYAARFFDGGAQSILNIRDDRRVGINATTIDAALTAAGLGATSSTYGLIVTNSSGTTSTAALVVRDDNRVGIRTNAPQTPLNVVGTGTTSGSTALLVEGSGGQDNLNVRDDGVVIGQGLAMASSAPSISFGGGAGTGPSNDLTVGGANGFSITFTSGTSPTAGAAIFTATLPKSYPNGVVATMTCASDTCLDKDSEIRISGTGNNSVTLTMKSGSSLVASTSYSMFLTIIGY